MRGIVGGGAGLLSGVCLGGWRGMHARVCAPAMLFQLFVRARAAVCAI